MSDCRRVDIYDDEGAYYLAPKDGTHALMLWEEYQRWVARVQKANEILDEGVRIDSKNRDEIDRLRDEVERLKEWQKDTILDLDRARRLLDRATAKLNSGVLITDEQIDEAWSDPVELHHGDERYIKASAIGIVECPECESGGQIIENVMIDHDGNVRHPVNHRVKCPRCQGHGWTREERGDE